MSRPFYVRSDLFRPGGSGIIPAVDELVEGLDSVLLILHHGYAGSVHGIVFPVTVDRDPELGDQRGNGTEIVHHIGGGYQAGQFKDSGRIDVGDRILDEIGDQIEHIQLAGLDLFHGLLQQAVQQVAGAGCADEVAVDAPETGVHQRLDAVQMLDAVLLFQLVTLAVLIVIGIGDFPAVGDFFALGVPDRAGGQIGIDAYSSIV